MAERFFTPALFGFLRELRENNERAWFQANQARFEAEVREPILAFILALGEPLAGISRHLEANPARSGGSMFRINRDTRFAHDKSPYKTNVGAQFRHRSGGRDVHVPGFYLHLEPGGCFGSAGMWHPDPEALGKVRQRILDKPREWTALEAKGIEVLGDRLVRVPLGLRADHPQADALRLKDYYASTAFSESEVCAGDFLERYAESCRSKVPLMKFLAKALDLPL